MHIINNIVYVANTAKFLSIFLDKKLIFHPYLNAKLKHILKIKIFYLIPVASHLLLFIVILNLTMRLFHRTQVL